MSTVLLDFSRPHVLRTEAEYDAAVERMDELLDAGVEEGSEDYELLKFLAVLIEAYDDEHYPMGEKGTPQSMVDFMLEQNGLERSVLNRVMGGQSRVSEFFAGKRPLSLGQIKGIQSILRIPADLLIQ
jgi:HTH-type transcriptional regulator/antitoxin HigA